MYVMFVPVRHAVTGQGVISRTFFGDQQPYRGQFKEGDKEADRRNEGKTTSKCGLALIRISHFGKLRTTRSGGSWLYNLQWCPNGQPDYGIEKIRSEEPCWSDLQFR